MAVGRVGNVGLAYGAYLYENSTFIFTVVPEFDYDIYHIKPELVRVWFKADLAREYGFSVRTLIRTMRKFRIETGGASKTISPKQARALFEEYGTPPLKK